MKKYDLPFNTVKLLWKYISSTQFPDLLASHYLRYTHRNQEHCLLCLLFGAGNLKGILKGGLDKEKILEDSKVLNI